jgi:gliding motility-associated protein GldL
MKSVSEQIESLGRINAGLMRIKEMYEGSVMDSSIFRSETEKMTQQIHALNGVYNRLLNAMTMNMYGGGPSHYNPNPMP